MSFLTGLHGSIATVLICSLLVVDEAGVPLPFAPSEALLIVGGLLIASGGLSLVIFLPLACGAIVLGSFVGYSWARAVGPAPLRALAGKVGAEKSFDRASRRLRTASPRSIGVSRLIPGARPFITLAAGASHVPRHTFMAGSVPAAIVWSTALTLLGLAVGVPAERVLGEVAQLAVSGAILVILGFGAYRAARRCARHRPEITPFSGVSPPGRLVLALAVDAGVVATIVAGLDRITRSVLDLKVSFPLPEGRYDAALVIGAVALAYIVAIRLGRQGETAGERLFEVSYVHRPPRPRLPPRESPPVEPRGAERVAHRRAPGARAGTPHRQPRRRVTTDSM